MIIIEVRCFQMPSIDSHIYGLTKAITEAVSTIESIAQREQDVTVRFPSDLKKNKIYIASEISIEIICIFESLDIKIDAINHLAVKVGRVVYEILPEKKIDCRALQFSPINACSWNSSDKPAIELISIREFMEMFPRTPMRSRIKDVLFFAKIKTIGELLNFSRKELRLQRNFGYKSLQELEEMLKDRLDVKLKD